MAGLDKKLEKKENEKRNREAKRNGNGVLGSTSSSSATEEFEGKDDISGTSISDFNTPFLPK